MSAFRPLLKFELTHYRLFCGVPKPDGWTGEALTDAAHHLAGGGLRQDYGTHLQRELVKAQNLLNEPG